MRKLLIAAVLVAGLPAAHAQDKGKSDFTHGAEFRLRDTFEQNESGNGDTKPAHHNGVEQRFKLNMKYKANEKFSMNASLLQSASWGQLSTETNVGDRGATAADPDGSERNFMSVNEAYVTWMMSEDFNAKFGRMNFSFGDGSVMAVNDWQRQPYSFDGVVGNYEMEFGKFSAFAFKYRDLSGVNTASSDGQHDAYGLVFDLKTMPEMIKAINVHVIQDVADGVYANGTTNNINNTVNGQQNQSTLRWGVMGKVGFGPLDVKANYEMVGGKYSDTNAGGAIINNADRTVNMSMYQAEVGFNMPNLMNSRFFVKYHVDSGTSKNDQTPNGIAANSTSANTYDGYFYDKAENSGAMELVGWGNLTALNAGWTFKPTDKSTFGLAYWMFSKTDGEDFTTAGTYGTTLVKGTKSASDASKEIGNEIDVWAEHQYDGGLSMIARVGYFMPGGWLKADKDNVTPTPGTIKKGDSITQVMVQGKLTF